MQSIAKDKFQVIGLEENAVEETARPRIGYFQDAWRRLRQNKVATLALFILIAIVIMVIIGPKLSGYAYEETSSRVQSTGLEQINLAEICLQEFGLAGAYR